MSERSCVPVTTDDSFIEWHSPYVCGPTLLLISTLVFCKRQYRPTTLIPKLILYLCFFIIFTFVLDSYVITIRILLTDSSEDYLERVYYIGTSWLAWTISLVFWMKKGKCIVLFWELSLFVETVIGWFWFNNRSYENTDNMLYDQLLFGIYFTRYVVEIAIVILSWIRLTTSTATKEKYSLLTTKVTTTHYGTARTVTYTTYRIRGTESGEGWFALFSRYSSLKLLLCLFIMCLDTFITILYPRQMGRIVDNRSNVDTVTRSSTSLMMILVGFTFAQQGVLRPFAKFLLGDNEKSIALVQSLFPVIANTVAITIYTLYVYGLTTSLILFATTTLHIYYILLSSTPSEGEQQSSRSHNWWHTLIESTIASGGLLWGSVVFGHRMATCEVSPGDYVAFNMYLVQLHSLHSLRTCIEKVVEVKVIMSQEEILPKNAIVVNKIQVEPDRSSVGRMRHIGSQVIHINDPPQGSILTETIELYDDED